MNLHLTAPKRLVSQKGYLWLQHTKLKAFSLVEMMLVLCLITIMTLVVSPSLVTFLNKAKLSSQLNIINSQLQLAKSTAATQFVYVVFCPTDNRIRCSNNWRDEIISFIDKNNNGVVESFDTIINSHKISTSLDINVNRKMIKFSPINTAATTAVTVSLCFGKRLKKALVVSNVGRIRLSNDLTKINCNEQLR
jgi:type IV fimbrial biogenesis protein FimT